MSCRASVPISLKKVLSTDFTKEYCIIEEVLESSRKSQRAYTPCKKKRCNEYVCKNHITQKSELYFENIKKYNICPSKELSYDTIPSYHQPLQCNITPELQKKIQTYIES